mmetsp:Transcript_6374/g.11068  ORF Transcript_6374/g.11068 Transcript_6374/m.11068 type:complete len:209 (-) Transcript_6374:735-1361(-)
MTPNLPNGKRLKKPSMISPPLVIRRIRNPKRWSRASTYILLLVVLQRQHHPTTTTTTTTTTTRRLSFGSLGVPFCRVMFRAISAMPNWWVVRVKPMCFWPTTACCRKPNSMIRCGMYYWPIITSSKSGVSIPTTLSFGVFRPGPAIVLGCSNSFLNANETLPPILPGCVCCYNHNPITCPVELSCYVPLWTTPNPPDHSWNIPSTIWL